MRKWIVVGLVETEDGAVRKNTKVKANSKEDAIIKGLDKMKTRRIIECKLISEN